MKNYDARLMGADPTASPVTGECSTVELQPHNCELAMSYKVTDFLHLINLCRGRESNSRPVGYDSTALPTELPRLILMKITR